MAVGVAPVLRRWPFATLPIGVVALPACTFLFGLLLFVLELGDRYPFHLGNWGGQAVASPLVAGMAAVSGLSWSGLGLMLVPFSVWTTYQLRLLAEDVVKL
ncbi:MAG: hypothetical protein ABJA98_22900 [Acidobacteriota bacterium]